MSNLFDDHANDYDMWFTQNDQLYLSELDAVKSMLDADKKYIEVGVGTGLFASKLGIVEGVEPSSEMAAFATMRGIKVHSAVAEHLPYEDGSVEGLLMITVDCFVKDIKPVFDEAYRVLRDGGSYVMAFLDRGTPLGAIYEANKNDDIYYKDATFRSSREMIAYLEASGFAIDKLCQNVYTLDNKIQPTKDGNGEGVFALIKATKEIK